MQQTNLRSVGAAPGFHIRKEGEGIGHCRNRYFEQTVLLDLVEAVLQGVIFILAALVN